MPRHATQRRGHRGTSRGAPVPAGAIAPSQSTTVRFLSATQPGPAAGLLCGTGDLASQRKGRHILTLF